MESQSNAPRVPLTGWLLRFLQEPLPSHCLEESAHQGFSVLHHRDDHPVYLEKVLSFKILKTILPA